MCSYGKKHNENFHEQKDDGRNADTKEVAYSSSSGSWEKWNILSAFTVSTLIASTQALWLAFQN